MKLHDIVYETYSALSGNKVRSSLTVLGIVIGIASVIAMLAIGQGAQNAISERISSIGSNLIMVSSGAQKNIGSMLRMERGSAKTLTLKDADAITSLASISAVAPEVSGRYQITYKGTNTNAQVKGTVGAYATVKNVSVAEGTFLSDQNEKEMQKVVVIGPTVRDDLFGESATDVEGLVIRINSIPFTVIGVTTKVGGTGSNSADDMVYIPLSTAQQFLIGDKYVSSINVSAVNTDVMSTAQSEISELLLAQHGITDSTKADFTVLNQEDLIETASSVAETLTLLLGAVAGISLIVGGIGIMNMMLTTVTERTREIGLRKAIGAKRKDISTQFLAEALALTTTGGIIGVALGWLVSFIFSYFDIMSTSVSLFSVLLASGVSMCIGVGFGYYPARRAARLRPIDALRYE